MTDYTELIRSLRNCSNNRCTPCDCGWFNKYQVDESCKEIIMQKAAAVIEELDAEETRLLLLTSDLQDKLMDLQAEVKRLELDNEDYEHEQRRLKGEIEALQAQLPKRGEWVEENRRPRSSQFVCSECHRTAYDPQPTRDKAWRKRCRYAYCPNCGAKMEVRDADTK